MIYCSMYRKRELTTGRHQVFVIDARICNEMATVLRVNVTSVGEEDGLKQTITPLCEDHALQMLADMQPFDATFLVDIPKASDR